MTEVDDLSITSFTRMCFSSCLELKSDNKNQFEVLNMELVGKARITRQIKSWHAIAKEGTRH
jgi:hypothetical protein